MARLELIERLARIVPASDRRDVLVRCVRPAGYDVLSELYRRLLAASQRARLLDSWGCAGRGDEEGFVALHMSSAGGD